MGLEPATSLSQTARAWTPKGNRPSPSYIALARSAAVSPQFSFFRWCEGLLRAGSCSMRRRERSIRGYLATRPTQTAGSQFLRDLCCLVVDLRPRAPVPFAVPASRVALARTARDKPRVSLYVAAGRPAPPVATLLLYGSFAANANRIGVYCASSFTTPGNCPRYRLPCTSTHMPCGRIMERKKPKRARMLPETSKMLTAPSISAT